MGEDKDYLDYPPGTIGWHKKRLALRYAAERQRFMKRLPTYLRREWVVSVIFAMYGHDSIRRIVKDWRER